MMNLLACGLVLCTFLAAEVWSPSPTMTTSHAVASEGDVIVKDGHHVVVVEYDRDGKTNTRILIRPPSAADQGEEQKGSSLFENAKENMKESEDFGQGILQPTKEEIEEEARDHHATTGEVICDAFGKCRQKIASVIGRGKDRTTDNVEETASDVGDTVAGQAQYVKDKVTERAHDVKESLSHKAEEAKEKVTDKAYDVKDTVAHKVYDVKDAVAHIAYETKERAKDEVGGKAQELKETMAHNSHNAWERVKHGAREFGSATATALSPTKVASVVGLTAIAAAFGTCVWVTFVSSYVLASVLGRQQFGVVQSKLYPVYFKAISAGILVGLLGHVLSRRRRLLTDATEMWQGVNLLAAFFMIEANKSFVEPRATKSMFERMKAEKEEGRGGERTTNEQEVRRKLEKLSERLSKLNTYSSWLNILTLMSLTWHFVYLGQRLAAC